MKQYILILILLIAQTSFAQPSNDVCSFSTAQSLSAVTVANTSNAFNCNTTGATQSYTPDNCPPNLSTHANDVFFKFTATQNSYIVKVTPSSGYDPAVFVYASCGSSQVINCSDDGGGNGFDETVNLNNLIIGQTYYVRVYDYDNTSSTICATKTFQIWLIAPSTIGNPLLSLSNSSIQFGNTQTNTSNSQTIIISNTGNADLLINNVTSTSSAFSVPNNIPLISAGSNFQLNVTFNPTVATSYGGNINIYSNTSSSPDQVSVSGIGTTVATPQMSLAPNNIDFGSIQTSTTSAPEQLIITNSGNASLVVSQLTTPTGFATDWSSGTIAAGHSKIANITFSPTSASTYTGNISITSNVTNKNIPVLGNGLSSAPTVISGTIKDMEVSWQSSTVLNSGISSCTVNLKNGSGTILNSVLTNSQGFFSIPASAGSNYTIEAVKSNLTGTFKVAKTNVSVGSNIEILIPNKITSQITAILDDLEILEMQISEYNETKIVGGYSTIEVRNTTSSFQTYNNSFIQVKENLTRIYLAERILNNYYDNAALIGDEISTDFNAFFGIFGRLMSIQSTLKDLSKNSYILELVFRPIDIILDGCIDLAITAVKKISSAFVGKNKADFESKFDFVVDGMSMLIKRDSKSILNLASSPIQLAVTELTPYVVNKTYVLPTQPNLPILATKGLDLNPNYLTNCNVAIKNTKNQVYSVTDHATQTKSAMANLYLVNSIGQGIDDFTTKTAFVLSFTGVGAGVSAALSAIGTAASVIGYAAVGYSCVKGIKEFIYLKNQVNPDITNIAFYKTEQGLSQLTPQQSSRSTTNLADAINDYNYTLQSISDNIDYSQESLAFSKLDSLQVKHQTLNTAISESLNPIIAASPILYDSILGFGDAYYSQLMNPVFDANAKKIELAFDFIALALDTTNYSNNTTIVSHIADEVTANNNLLVAVNQFSNLAIGVAVPVYPAITEKIWNRQMLKSTNSTLKIKFKNYGNIDMTNTYAKITTHNGFTVNNDSVYIGTLLPNVEDSLIYTIMSPAFDTIGGFQWQLISDNSYGLGTGGAIQTTDKILNKINEHPNLITGFKLYPNPTANTIYLEKDVEIKGDISAIITDLTGRTIITKQIFIQENATKENIAINDIPSGNYILSIYSKVGTQTFKIIKK